MLVSFSGMASVETGVAPSNAHAVGETVCVLTSLAWSPGPTARASASAGAALGARNVRRSGQRRPTLLFVKRLIKLSRVCTYTCRCTARRDEYLDPADFISYTTTYVRRLSPVGV